MTEESYVDRLSPHSRRLWPSTSPLHFRHLDIELTERCDNDCIHCSINRPLEDSEARQRELTTGEWKRIIREAADLGVISVRFTGGEPLVREDFTEIYRFTRRLGIKVILFTNARKMTPARVRLLLRMPPLEKIQVSVYGMNCRSYEAVTRMPGSYRDFTRGVDRLLAKGIPFEVKGAVLPPNRDQISDFESWAAALPGMETPPGFSLFYELRTRRDSETRNRRISALRLSPEEGIGILTRHRGDYLQGMRRFCRRFLAPPGERLFTCGAGDSGCVDAYGKYQPCLQLRVPQLVYDLRVGSLQGAREKFFPRLRTLKAENPDYLSRCARCFIKALCQQCPARSWSEHGTLDTPVDYYCRIAHAQARFIGLLKEGELAWEVKNWKERVAECKEDVHA